MKASRAAKDVAVKVNTVPTLKGRRIPIKDKDSVKTPTEDIEPITPIIASNPASIAPPEITAKATLIAYFAISPINYLPPFFETLAGFCCKVPTSLATSTEEEDTQRITTSNVARVTISVTTGVKALRTEAGK